MSSNNEAMRDLMGSPFRYPEMPAHHIKEQTEVSNGAEGDPVRRHCFPVLS
jgi:hypothetical protein